MPRIAVTLFSFATSLLLATACHNDRQAGGPLERAGRGVDTAAQKTGEALERAGNATSKAFKGAGTDLGVRGSPDKKATGKPPSEPSKPGPTNRSHRPTSDSRSWAIRPQSLRYTQRVKQAWRWGWGKVAVGLLALLSSGCSKIDDLKNVCIPGDDCTAINSIETSLNCQTCLDCPDNWGNCTPGGAACKRGALDLDPAVSGCEAVTRDAGGQWLLHSAGDDAVSSFLFNGGRFDLPMVVSIFAADQDEPSCVPSASISCTYTVHAFQLEIPDFMIPESSWSGGVATLNGPITATDYASGAQAVAPMQFAFDVRDNVEERVALSSANVSFRVDASSAPDLSSILIEADSIDFGGYEITQLFFNGTLKRP